MKRFKGVLVIMTVITILSIGNVSNANSFDELKIVEPNKMWTIVFNDFVNFSDNINDLILVKDSKGIETDIRLELGDDDKSICVYSPNEGYNLGEIYNLHIDQNVKSTKGNTLKESINMNFKIKEKLDEIKTYNFTGQENLSLDGFLNILNGSLEIENEQITLYMYLRDIPYGILFNKTHTPDNGNEYRWGVGIGTASSKGYEMSASRFKFPGSEPETLPIERAVQTNVWKLDKHPSESLSGSYLNNARISIDYNSNLIKITGTIPGISEEEIDYIQIFAKKLEYNGLDIGDEIFINLEK